MLHRTKLNLLYALATFGEARALKNFMSWITSSCLGFSTTEGDVVSDFHLYTEDRKKSAASIKTAILNATCLAGYKIKLFWSINYSQVEIILYIFKI